MELAKITKAFILRRTSKVNEKYLPSKTELTVMCKLTPEQVKIYQYLCAARLRGQKKKSSGGGIAAIKAAAEAAAAAAG